mmetsp:Transcript_19648/g.58268  ORF Transcript_19648/g.58268 Transcript_19648/m.58268 type:complete len:491 (+) Transcript_19648:52-1524(+)
MSASLPLCKGPEGRPAHKIVILHAKPTSSLRAHCGVTTVYLESSARHATAGWLACATVHEAHLLCRPLGRFAANDGAVRHAGRRKTLVIQSFPVGRSMARCATNMYTSVTWHLHDVASRRRCIPAHCLLGRLLNNALELLLSSLDRLLRLAFNEQEDLALARRRLLAGRHVHALGDECAPGQLCDVVDRLTVHHLPARVLWEIVHLQLRLKVHRRAVCRGCGSGRARSSASHIYRHLLCRRDRCVDGYATRNAQRGMNAKRGGRDGNAGNGCKALQHRVCRRHCRSGRARHRASHAPSQARCDRLRRKDVRVLLRVESRRRGACGRGCCSGRCRCARWACCWRSCGRRTRHAHCSHGVCADCCASNSRTSAGSCGCRCWYSPGAAHRLRCARAIDATDTVIAVTALGTAAAIVDLQAHLLGLGFARLLVLLLLRPVKLVSGAAKASAVALCKALLALLVERVSHRLQVLWDRLATLLHRLDEIRRVLLLL